MTSLPETEHLRGRVVANTFAQLVAPGLRVGVGVVLFAILGRYLGVTGLGEYGLVVAYVLLFTNALGDWGLAAILVREIARRPEQRASLIASATLLQLVLAALSYCALLAMALFSGLSVEVRSSLALFGLTVLLAPVQMLAAHFAIDLRLVRLVPPAVAGTLTQLVLVLVAVASHGPLIAIIAAGTAAVAVEHGWTAVIALRDLPFGRPALASAKLFLREAWPLAIGTLVAAGVRQAPVLVLSAISIEAVGIFTAATKIPDYLARVPYAFRATMLPLLSRRWQEPSRFGELVEAVVAGTLLLAAPLTVIGVLLSHDIVTIVFGRAFADAAAPFATLMIAFIFVSLGTLLEAALVAMGGQRVNLLIRTMASVILLIVLVVLAPRTGANGAAAAVLGSAAAAVLLDIAVIARRGGLHTGRSFGFPLPGRRA